MAPARRDGVAPDGSPVAVFAALPDRGVATMLHAAIAPGATVLELGCGAGRIVHGLAALGHRVTAVDNSAAMLECVHDAECIGADLFALDLGRHFDCVIAGSYLVNSWPEGLLAACARHLDVGGIALVQRYDPAWARDAQPGSAEAGEVIIAVDPISCVDDHLVATVRYSLDGRQWEQSIDALVLDDEGLAAFARHAGLRVERYLDEFREWARLVRAPVDVVEVSATGSRRAFRRRRGYRRA